jgi:hypothetical protein
MTTRAGPMARARFVVWTEAKYEANRERWDLPSSHRVRSRARTIRSECRQAWTSLAGRPSFFCADYTFSVGDGANGARWEQVRRFQYQTAI